jgi:dolichol-phosphate mannosyltransferase
MILANTKLFLLLPAYNEDKALPSLLAAVPHKLTGLDFEVVVVDDGSSDRTAAVAAEYPVTLLRHERNKGLGEALKTGLIHVAAHGRADDLLLTMDADDTHDPALVFPMREKIINNDIVIASRYCPGGVQTGVGAVRALLSRLMSLVMQLIFPVKGANDYSSGFRLYRVELISRGLKKFGDRLIESSGFSCMPELLVKLAALGARVAEVPLVMHYELKKSGSKFRPLDLVRGYLALFLILRRAVRRAR